MNGKRADVALVERGLAGSRTAAQALIMAGDVSVKSGRVDKPSHIVKDDDELTVAKPPEYVSRGGQKIAKALDHFGVNLNGRVAMDVGASTGGFTDAMLRRGVRKVYAIDVGYGQLAERLRHDERVVVMERTNARYLTRDMFDEQPTLCVADVSFISLRLILPAVFDVIGRGDIICLVKPQFEVGRAKVQKGGVVHNTRDRADALQSIIDFARERGWYAHGVTFSPILGPAGNVEFLLWLRPEPIDIPEDAALRVATEAVGGGR